MYINVTELSYISSPNLFIIYLILDGSQFFTFFFLTVDIV
uniref:Uncharacterized protein n=1 Tax=Arundo donax TaxID=35708 RepID=A0A0A9G2P2_ARUDO